MNYYLVNKVKKELSFWQIVDDQQQWVTKVVPSGTVMNAIIYDGTSVYTPENGIELKSSENVYSIGDTFNN